MKGGFINEAQKTRGLAEQWTGGRCVVAALRESLGHTLPFVAKHEAEGVELAKRHVDRLAFLHADEAGGAVNSMRAGLKLTILPQT